jgi:hemerythrin superfamily protein
VKQLFDHYFQARDEEEKKETGWHILLLLDEHAALEEQVFYPAVRNVDSSLVDRCEQEHEQARQLIETLKLIDKGDPQADSLFHQLADAILKHIATEEEQLFAEVGQAQLDLSAIGHDMQAFEIRMIAARSPRPVAPGLR